MLKRYAPHPWTVLSAFLIVISFPPLGVSPLIWIALVPWFLTFRKTNSSKAGLIQGFWLSFLMTLGCFFWVAHSLHRFGNLPWPLAIVGLFIFGSFNQAQFLLVGFFMGTSLLRRRKIGPVAIASLYTAIDWLVPKLFCDTLGHSLWNMGWVFQLAEMGGAFFLTWIIVFVNAMLERSLSERSWKSLLWATGVLGLAFLAGGQRYYEVQTLMDSAKSKLSVAIIQANIGDFDKVAAETGIGRAADAILDKHIQLSEQAMLRSTKPDVVIWAETAYSSTFRKPFNTLELGRDRRIEEWVKKHKTPLWFGGYDRDLAPPRHEYNSIFFLSPPSPGTRQENQLSVYHKSVLLPFAEYIPGTENIEWVRRTFPQVGYFGRGGGPDAMPLELRDGRKLNVTPVICYEALFSNFGREGKAKGSQLIVNVTNDSWFGPWGEPHLHLALSTFRSVETRMPQVRATNTGISAIILPTGEVTEASPIGVPMVAFGQIPMVEIKAGILQAYGDWIGWVSALLAIFFVAPWARRRI